LTFSQILRQKDMISRRRVPRSDRRTRPFLWALPFVAALILYLHFAHMLVLSTPSMCDRVTRNEVFGVTVYREGPTDCSATLPVRKNGEAEAPFLRCPADWLWQQNVKGAPESTPFFVASITGCLAPVIVETRMSLPYAPPSKVEDDAVIVAQISWPFESVAYDHGTWLVSCLRYCLATRCSIGYYIHPTTKDCVVIRNGDVTQEAFFYPLVPRSPPRLPPSKRPPPLRVVPFDQPVNLYLDRQASVVEPLSLTFVVVRGEPLYEERCTECNGVFMIETRVKSKLRTQHFPAMNGVVRFGSELLVPALGESLEVTAKYIAPDSGEHAEVTTRFGVFRKGVTKSLFLGDVSLFAGPECAPLLAEGECCLGGLSAGWVSEDGIALASNERARFVYAAVHNSTNPGCLRLVDGMFTAVDSIDGVGEFTRLVAKWTCGGDPAAAMGTTWLKLQPDDDGEPVAVSHQSVAMCGVAPKRGTAIAAPREIVGGSDPVLFSVGAYECVDCVEDLFENLDAFSPGSLVAVHIWPRWQLTGDEQTRLGALFGAPYDGRRYRNHRPVHIVTKLRVHMIHVSNIAFMLRDHTNVKWSHVVFFHANERLVRPGIGSYVQRFDLSLPRSSPMGGFGYAEMTDEDPTSRYARLDRDIFAKRAPLQLSSTPEIRAGVLRMDAMALSKDHVYFLRGSHVGEGSFFNRSIAVSFVQAFSPVLHDEQSLCDGAVYCDVLPSFFFIPYCMPNTSVSSRCGQRISTLVQSRSNFTAQLSDIAAVRCSPFEAPFGLKRIKPNTTVAAFIRSLQRKERETGGAVRDTDAMLCSRAYQGEWWW